MSGSGRSRGDGCLYALLALGVFMVGAAGALEFLGELAGPSSEVPIEEAPGRGFVVPGQATPLAPAPPAPAPGPPSGARTDPGGLQGLLDTLPPDLRDELEDDLVAEGEPVQTLLWHAQTLEDSPVACVLRLDATAQARPTVTGLSLGCADGRWIDASPQSAGLASVGTRHGAAFRATIASSRGTDGSGRALTISVDTSAHAITVSEGALAGTLFVEDLSVPNPNGTQIAQGAVDECLVRLAVPTLVEGPIPTAIAMVRATGRVPRVGSPVCVLTGGPVPDSSFSCRLLVRCDGEMIYGQGSSGYNRCDAAEGRITSAQDTGSTPEDSDPRVDLDMAEGRLIVSDVSEQGEWSATFDLIVDPRCGRDVGYAGSLWTSAGRSSLQVTPFAPTPSIVIEGELEALAATLAECGGGRVEFTRVAETVHSDLFFGRGARSVAGYIGADGDAAWAFAP